MKGPLGSRKPCVPAHISRRGGLPRNRNLAGSVGTTGNHPNNPRAGAPNGGDLLVGNNWVPIGKKAFP
eukprot:8738045-Heterocapsa_arctica.AAC.1